MNTDKKHRLHRFYLLPFTFYLLPVFFAGCASIQKRVQPPHIENGEVVFQYISPSARNVSVAGEFNGWEYRQDQQRAIRLEKKEKNVWIAKSKIEPGRYQYKFVVDYQTWILDPYNPYTIDDGTGNINSLLIVK
jgi:1,4-alpha-glucan branching enzyme